MKGCYDLHIHTVLSPCADVLMTPNNLWNMATIKRLSFVAFVDHNSFKQLPVLLEIAKSYSARMMIGAEIALADDVHVLLYLKQTEDALAIDGWLDGMIPKESYDVMHRGEQILTDLDDLTVSTVPYLLSRPLPISIFDLKDRLKNIEHRLVLAHWNRYPQKAEAAFQSGLFDAVEWTSPIPDDWKKRHPGVKVLFNSDAHELTDILECGEVNRIAWDDPTVEGFFGWTKHE
jgi:hypothetical protein